MLDIDKQSGLVYHSRVSRRIFPNLARGAMPVINGIVVHQTDSPTAASVFNAYRMQTNGAHFLIEKDGTIYQTVPLNQRADHVGYLRARCLKELRCKPTSLNELAISAREYKKRFPDRYPANPDSIGIEVVGECFKKKDIKCTYELMTQEQSDALKWLIDELMLELGVLATEVYLHPEISYKNKTEGRSGTWRP